MNKGELIEVVASGMNSSKADASKAVDAVMEAITQGLSKDAKVSIAGFGTFQKKNRSARMGINPATKEPMEIRATTTCSFRPSPQLREHI